MSEKNIHKKTPIKKGVAKVPVVMQLEALECGAACLTMILAYYNKWIPLEQVRKDCGVSRDGSKASNVLKAARSYGMTTSGYKCEPDYLRREGTFPCIIHWNFNHFIVLKGFRGGKVYINDPARGELIITLEEFNKAFTGIALMMEPGDDFVPEGAPKSMLSYTRKRLEGAGPAVVFVALTTIITSLMGIISPGFSRIFLDRLLPGNNPSWVTPFIIALAAFSALGVFVNVLTEIYSLRINGKLAIIGNSTYFWKVLHMPMEFFSQRMTGDIQQRMGTNAGIAKTLVDIFGPLFINAGMMLFYLVVMIRYSPILTLVGLVSIFVNILVAGIISKKRVNITRVQMRDSGKLYGMTISGIEMIETIKASGAEDGFLQKWTGYLANVNTSFIKESKMSAYLNLIPTITTQIINVVIMALGVLFAMKGNFTVGMIMAFQGFLSSFTAPVTELTMAGQTITEMRTQMERVEDVMEYPEDVVYSTMQQPDKDSTFSKLSGHIELKNVTFGYSPLDNPLITDFSMKIKPGQRVAFVGASGCGKSTLSKLISGLYQPWEGEILFDGKPMNEIDRDTFTSSIAVVDQDIILFDDTIDSNIRMWDASIQNFEVILAARDAQIHEDIMQRPGGYNYKIMENGKDFSGGERQRLEIARVLAADPTILILDEATSALDAKTELDVVNSIKNRGVTCIIVAHRLSTIRDCDEIIVLDNGQVVERGTHEELMKHNGMYTQLITSE